LHSNKDKTNPDFSELGFNVLDSMQIPILIINNSFDIIYFNEYSKKKFNLIISSNLKEIFEFDPRTFDDKSSNKRLRYQNQLFDVVTSQNDWDPKGNAYKFLIFNDITSSSELRDKISELEKYYSVLAENSSDIIMFLNPEGIIQYSSRSVESIIDILAENLIGKNIKSILTEESFENTQKRIINLVDGIDSKHPFIIDIKGKNGTLIPYELNTTSIIKNGKIDGIQLVARNISERLRYQKRLDDIYQHTDQLSKTKTIQDIAIITLNAVEQILGYINCGFGIVENGYLKYILSKSDEFKDQRYSLDATLPQIFALKTGNIQLNSSSKPGSNAVTISMDAPVILDEQAVALISVKSGYKEAFLNEDLKLIETLALNVASALDRLSYLISLENIIEDISVKLEKAQRLATIGEVAAMVGHDLRNPLQVLVGTVDILENILENDNTLQNSGKEIKKWLNIISEQTSYMNKTVSDIQDYARTIKLNCIETDCIPFFDNIIDKLKLDNVKVIKNYSKPIPPIHFDPNLMQRCITNLLTNSLQAMPQGGTLTLNISFNTPNLIIEIRDTGVGISPEHMENIFKPLYTTKSKGTGFGLPVCKRVIDAHGGNILVKSTPNIGTNIIISIPTENRS